MPCGKVYKTGFQHLWRTVGHVNKGAVQAGAVQAGAVQAGAVPIALMRPPNAY
jgi:hypothetical protein